MRKKNPAECFKIQKDIFLIFQKLMSKKIAPRILRFVSIPFFNISKMDKQKKCARNIEIHKYTFFNI